MSNEIVPVVLEGDFISGEPLSDEQILLNAEMIYGYQKREAEGARNVYPLNYSKVNVGRGWTPPRQKGFFATLFGL